MVPKSDSIVPESAAEEKAAAASRCAMSWIAYGIRARHSRLARVLCS